MNVLVACEESQVVCLAFRRKGHNAFSCDLQEPSGGHPEYHVYGDVTPLLNGRCTFQTMDGKTHSIPGTWDLIVAHPPCTYLANSGACRMFPKSGQIDRLRYEKALRAQKFFMQIYNADCPRICIENPKPLSVVGLPPKSDSVNWTEFGGKYSKLTYFWLKGLPPLFATALVCGDISSWVMSTRSPKERSKTFPGIAAAMAEQWG